MEYVRELNRGKEGTRNFRIDIIKRQENASNNKQGREKALPQQIKDISIHEKDLFNKGWDNCVVNPAAQYVSDMGYTYKIMDSPQGGEYGIVKFPDNTTCDEWAFFSGKCGHKWSYCEQHGGKIVNREGLDDRYLCSSFAVCVFPDGSECLEDDYSKGFCKPGQKYKIQNQTWDK